jgi:GNAT superfamily N-acetyltransferase
MIHYRSLGRADLTELISLYETYLNGGAYIRETLAESISRQGFVGVKAVADGEFIGFFSGNDTLEFTYPHPELERRLEMYTVGHKYFSPDALLVKPQWRHEGVASVLVDKVREQLRAQGYEYFIVEMWVYPDGTIPEQRSLEQMGRVVWREMVPDFYKDLDQYGIDCPICGKHCVCGALIEVMSIHEDGE